MRNWDEIGRDEQIKLLMEYGIYLNGLPSVCNMQTKEERLREWLAEQNVEWGVRPFT